MKGTILDFLRLAAEKPELAKELVELAAKHDFEFTNDELSDEDLERVAGGLDLDLVSYYPVTFSQPSPIIIGGGGMPKPPSPAPGA